MKTRDSALSLFVSLCVCPIVSVCFSASRSILIYVFPQCVCVCVRRSVYLSLSFYVCMIVSHSCGIRARFLSYSSYFMYVCIDFIVSLSLALYMCTIAPPYASCLPLYPTLLLSKLSISFDLYFPPSLNRNFHKIFMKCSLSLTSASFPPSPLCPIFTSASLSVFLIFDMTSHPLSRLEYSIAGRRHAWRQSDADVAALCSPRAWCFPVFSFLEFSRF